MDLGGWIGRRRQRGSEREGLHFHTKTSFSSQGSLIRHLGCKSPYDCQHSHAVIGIALPVPVFFSRPCLMPPSILLQHINTELLTKAISIHPHSGQTLLSVSVEIYNS